MKSSTLRRSNLTKERMMILEELSNRESGSNVAPSVYVRPNKEKELDVLWQNFRVNQKEDKSPGIYLVTGFIAGAIAMLIMTALLSLTVNNVPSDAISTEPVKEKAKLNFIPADKSIKNVSSSTQKSSVDGISESYQVKQGDTLAGIVVRFYGKYDVSKIEKIKQVNGLANENSLKLGQSLIIPLN